MPLTAKPMFSFYSPQALHFGRGQAAQTAALAAGFGLRVLIVHGSNAARAAWLIEDCHAAGLSVVSEGCGAEPSLPALEAALGRIGADQPDVLIAVGGGSVIDFAKALAALIPCAKAPLEYLEGVGGGKPLDTAPLPMIALPTTAGTGAEVTKNAVIAVPEHGVKVSLRDARMIPNIAIVDAALMQGAPRHVTLAAGLDAVTQVIEPYLSVKATPMTDALCQAAIPKGLAALRAIVEQDAADAWDDMAWVSTCGGLALANAGLGAVHGFAGVIGGQTGAPHGEICGALLPAVLASHVEKAKAGTQVHTRLMWILDLIDTAFEVETGAGLSALRNWSRDMGLRDLVQMGLDPEDHAQVAQLSAGASSMKGTPFALTHEDLIAILRA